MSILFETKKDLRMTEIIRRSLCSEGKGKGVSTKTVYSIYGRVVCPPPRSGERSAAAATAVVAPAAIAAATTATAAVATATTAATAAAAEEDDDQDDDPQTIAAPTIITTHKIASSKVRMFDSTRKHRASFHPMSLPQKGARQKEKRPTVSRWTFLYAVISPRSGWR